ncbi:hypothetical protein [Dickeya dianthicola]|nr:hypothetical protein [Dickeya dianthicola]
MNARFVLFPAACAVMSCCGPQAAAQAHRLGSFIPAYTLNREALV